MTHTYKETLTSLMIRVTIIKIILRYYFHLEDWHKFKDLKICLWGNNQSLMLGM